MSRQSLQRQFKICTVLLIVVPSLLIMAIYTIGQLKLAKQEKVDTISQRLSFQDRKINDWMTERADDIRTLSKLTTFQTSDEQHMKNTLNLVQQANGHFASLSYINKEGYFKVSTLTDISYPSAVNQQY